MMYSGFATQAIVFAGSIIDRANLRTRDADTLNELATEASGRDDIASAKEPRWRG